MRIIRILLMVLGALQLTCYLLHAQNIDYLAKAKEFLYQGDCERAEYAYLDYKKLYPNSDAEVEWGIDDCKKNQRINRALEFNVNGTNFRLMPVQGGMFKMGGDNADNKPVHAVTVSGFWMGETEVTQGLWKAVMGITLREQHNKCKPNSEIVGEGANYPMCYISYIEAEEFCRELNKLLASQLPAGYRFSLPTEAEWEFAARGGNKSHGYEYSGCNDVGEVAWYGNTYYCSKGHVHEGTGGNSNNQTHPVGKLKSNELGLYDMSGNLWEFCCDFYQENYYEIAPSHNPQCGIPDKQLNHIIRGGEFSLSDIYQKVDVRARTAPDECGRNFGFRIVLVRR